MGPDDLLCSRNARSWKDGKGSLAVLLLAATVDPRLAEPLRLLTEVGACDTTDGHLSPYFANLPESLGLKLAVTK